MSYRWTTLQLLGPHGAFSNSKFHKPAFHNFQVILSGSSGNRTPPCRVRAGCSALELTTHLVGPKGLEPSPNRLKVCHASNYATVPGGPISTSPSFCCPQWAVKESNLIVIKTGGLQPPGGPSHLFTTQNLCPKNDKPPWFPRAASVSRVPLPPYVPTSGLAIMMEVGSWEYARSCFVKASALKLPWTHHDAQAVWLEVRLVSCVLVLMVSCE